MSMSSLPILDDYVRSETFTTVTMKNAVSWDVAPCRSCVNRCIGVTYGPHLHPEDGVTSQKTAFFIVRAVKTSNLTT
jgi:hypothetical protein